jgi:hypothetical protein
LINKIRSKNSIKKFDQKIRSKNSIKTRVFFFIQTESRETCDGDETLREGQRWQICWHIIGKKLQSFFSLSLAKTFLRASLEGGPPSTFKAIRVTRRVCEKKSPMYVNVNQPIQFVFWDTLNREFFRNIRFKLALPICTTVMHQLTNVSLKPCIYSEMYNLMCTIKNWINTYHKKLALPNNTVPCYIYL